MASPELKPLKEKKLSDLSAKREGVYLPKRKEFRASKAGTKRAENFSFEESFQLLSKYLFLTPSLEGQLLLNSPPEEKREGLLRKERPSEEPSAPKIRDSSAPLKKFLDKWSKTSVAAVDETRSPGVGRGIGEKKGRLKFILNYNRKAVEELSRAAESADSGQLIYICGAENSGKAEFLEALKLYFLEKFPHKKLLYSKGKKLAETLMKSLRRFPRQQIYQYFIDNSDIVFIDGLAEPAPGISARALKELAQLLSTMLKHRKRIFVTSTLLPSQLSEKNTALGRAVQGAQLIYLRSPVSLWPLEPLAETIKSEGKYFRRRSRPNRKDSAPIEGGQNRRPSADSSVPGQNSTGERASKDSVDISKKFLYKASGSEPLPGVYTYREAIRLIRSVTVGEVLSQVQREGQLDRAYRLAREYIAYLSRELLNLSYQKLSQLLDFQWSPAQIRYAHLKIKSEVIEDHQRFHQIDRLERKLRAPLQHLIRINGGENQPTLFKTESKRKKKTKK